MDHLRGTGLSVDSDLDPYAAASDAKRDPADGAIRPLTKELIDCCYLDVWPGHTAIVDFGIDTDRHLGALQFAIREELVTPQELDAALGSGAKLTEIRNAETIPTAT